MNKVHSLLTCLIGYFSSAASLAQVQPTAAVSSRPLMEVKREVILVDTGIDDLGVTNVGATLSDPYVQYQAEAYNNDPQRDEAWRSDMSIGVEDAEALYPSTIPTAIFSVLLPRGGRGGERGGERSLQSHRHKQSVAEKVLQDIRTGRICFARSQQHWLEQLPGSLC